jgi:hypothetical protein
MLSQKVDECKPLVIGDFQTPADLKYAHALTTCVNSVGRCRLTLSNPR